MSIKEQPKRIRPKEPRDLRRSAAQMVRSPAGEQVIEAVCRFLLSAVLSAAEIFSGCTPFGLAFVAASGSGASGFSALLGAVVGTMLSRGFADGLRYAAAAILIFSVSFAFYDIKLYRRTGFMPLVAAAVNGVTGFIYLSSAGWTSSGLIYFVTEVFFTAAATYFYRVAFGGENAVTEDSGLKRQISLLILVATALIALAPICLYADISLGRTIAALMVMLSAGAGGVAGGGCVGLTLGLAMDFAAGGAPFYTMAYGISGLVAGILHRNGKVITVVTYIITNAVAVLWTWTTTLRVSVLYEVFLASVAFLILPGGIFDMADQLFDREELRPAQGKRVQQQTRSKLHSASQAFAGLYEVLRGTESKAPPVQADAARIFDQAANEVCKGCALQSTCWQENYVATHNACNDALPAMLRRGKAEPTDFPDHFSNRCIHFASFLSAVNQALIGLLHHRRYESRLLESRKVLAEQYGEMSTMLDGLAETVDAPVHTRREEPPLMALTGVASRRREGENHCGDAGTCFKTDEGTVYILLCDGMGSGDAAQQESGTAVELLRQFLTAGIPPEGALRTLATALGLRAEDGGGFTTIDLLEISLHTGKAAIYKFGAANSYLRRNTRIMAVTGNNLPAGAMLSSSARPDVTRFTLGIGDCVLLLSDGVTDEQSDEALREALKKYKPSVHPKDFAANLLANTTGGDDKTALLVYIDQRA